jgi:hypothetical protein
MFLKSYEILEYLRLGHPENKTMYLLILHHHELKSSSAIVACNEKTFLFNCSVKKNQFFFFSAKNVSYFGSEENNDRLWRICQHKGNVK